jgi:hypothetical protein
MREAAGTSEATISGARAVFVAATRNAAAASWSEHKSRTCSSYDGAAPPRSDGQTADPAYRVRLDYASFSPDATATTRSPCC